MALTYTVKARYATGNVKHRVVDILADGTYTASTGYTLAASDYASLIGTPGGITTTAADSQIVGFVIERNPGGVTAAYDNSNLALRFYEAGAEATTTISSKTVRCHIWHNPSNFK